MNEEEEVMPPMSDDELVSICMKEISNGTGGSLNSDSEENIALPLEYYFGKRPAISKTKAKDENASRYISQDVMDGVEATVAEIMPTFVGDMVAVFKPEDDRDEDQSRLESEMVNYLFFEEYDGHTIIQTALKDSLLHRNCTAKVFWDERTQVKYEEFENVPEMALQQLLQPTEEGEEIEVVEQEMIREGNTEKLQMVQMASEADPEMAQMAAQKNPQSIQMAMMEAQSMFNIKIKRTRVVGRPVVESLPPESVVVSGDHKSPVLQTARFAAYEGIQTASDLIEQGFDPDIVESLSGFTDTITDLSRSRNADELDYESAHESTRQIQVYECYLQVDFDGDGIAEFRKCIISNNQLLSNDTIESTELVGGTTQILPHKYRGVSLFDRLKAVQDAKTPVVRAVIDGSLLAATQRIIVETGAVNIDDLLTSRTGGVVRADNVQSVLPVPNPEVPQSTYSMLSYMDQQRSERGGSAVSTASQAQQVAGDTAHGIERAMSAMELNNAHIARTFGETFIRSLFVALHKVIKENFKGQITSKVNGRWISTMPEEWKDRTSVTVHIGSSSAERARMAGVMNTVVMLQRELLAQGSTLTNEVMAFKAITDSIKMSGIKNPERYMLDPESPEGQQASQQAAQAKQQAEQEAKAKEQLMIQSQVDLAKAENIKGMADIEANKVKLETERAKLASDNEIASLKIKIQHMQFNEEQFSDGIKFSADQAIKVAELELEAGRDMSKQISDNMKG